jgi:hypothetical protein
MFSELGLRGVVILVDHPGDDESSADRAARRGQVPAARNIAMIMCGKRANTALTAHDHGSMVAGAPGSRPRRGREGPEVLMVSSMILRHRG